VHVISLSRSVRILSRTAAIYALDGTAAALSLIIAIYLRVGAAQGDTILARAPYAVPLFTLVALATFGLFQLHRRVWRFASLGDVFAIAEAATLAILGFTLLLAAGGHIAWMPRSIPIIQWLVLVGAMVTMRVTRRVLGEYLSGSVAPPLPANAPERIVRRALIAGPSDQVEQLLRLLERQPESGFRAVGVLEALGIHERVWLRGVPILGSYNQLAQVVERLEADGQRPRCLIFAGGVERLRGAATVEIIAAAQQLDLEVAYPAGFTEYGVEPGTQLDFKYVNVAELLGRPQARLQDKVVAEAIRSRSVLVTGAGGTIGRELVRQIASCRPSKMLLLDANEFNLYEVDLEMAENHPDIERIPVLCSIRQRKQVMRVFAEHRPNLVFHAAALKHVPLVEMHLSAGIQTNVLGTRNVADAARQYGAMAMVQVSTDKAVNPVGFMGMTKRLGELYCQALDLECADEPFAPRFMTVRFGNVLGSSGSLIPLFQRQLSRGGPLTVTHPDIERFFMTVHEAVQLVLHSAACGLRKGADRGRIFVLDMGQPVRIMDVARRMIRLAGLEPDVDIPIEIVGLRPGEKLYEELFDPIEQQLPSALPGVFEAEPRPISLAVLDRVLSSLEEASANGDDARCRAIVESVLADRDGGMLIAEPARPAAALPAAAAPAVGGGRRHAVLRS